MKLIRFMKDNVVYHGNLGDNNKVGYFKNYSSYFDRLELIEDAFMLSEVKLLSPIKSPYQDIICLGINYLEHAKESYKFKGIEFDGKREEAVYFAKRVNEFSNPFDILDISGEKLDYECELAFVLRKDAYKLDDTSDFDDYILGYTILNDVSDRAIQNKHKQWYMGKSLANSCPFGSFINTGLSIKDASNLKVECFVNDEVRQSSNTNMLIFDIPYILKELSNYTCLKAGTIISTGTPSGVGMGFNPPKFLKSGDKIECRIERLGSLINYIK
ncbi:fumarylacetoacetate hydrolase family protein [Campylobacter sp. RM12647]|uniref:fumarylacetoacetate hydrolase family protein n=1 Tax=Campylobacter sp. RM12647 TaxID=2735737 RepID=UPI001D389012|nr:fumarylacetoacetate hydrolase family protein [Campylobacter sp. RM12647]